MGLAEGHKDVKVMEHLSYEDKLRALVLLSHGEEEVLGKFHCGLPVLGGSLQGGEDRLFT